MDETNEGQVGQNTAEGYKTTAPRIHVLENLSDLGDVYDNITEFPREEGDGAAEEIETSYETMTQTNRSIFYINDNTLKEDCWIGSRKQTEQLRLNRNITARKDRTGEGHGNSLYANADREERRVKLIDSASDGWVYVATGWTKKGVTSERQPRQTNWLRPLQKTESLCAKRGTNARDYRKKDSNKMVGGKSKILDRNVLRTKSERQTIQKVNKSELSTFKETRKPRSNIDSIVMDVLYDNEFPVSKTDSRSRAKTAVRETGRINKNNAMVSQYLNVENTTKMEHSNICSIQDQYIKMCLDQTKKELLSVKGTEYQHSNSVKGAEHQFSDSDKETEHQFSDSDKGTEHQFSDSDKGTEHQFSDSDKGTERERENEDSSDSNDGYEPVNIRSSPVKKCQDHANQALSDTSLRPSPVPRPHKERVSVLCTKPRPKPRSKSTCLQPNKGKEPSVSSQSSTQPKLTLTDINSNLTLPPHILQMTHGRFCQNEHESRDHRKRTPVNVPRSSKSTVIEETITKGSASSPPQKKELLLSLRSTSPDAKAPTQSKPLPPTPTSRNRDCDESNYLVVLPDITTDDFSSESKDTQSSPPPRPPKSHLITKRTNSESRTAAPASVDRCERSPRSPPMPPTALKDNDGYLLPINAPSLHKRVKTQSVAKDISPVCSSYQQDPPPRPPKTYTNRKSPTSSPTKGKPETLSHNVSPALKPLLPPKPSTLPHASPSFLRSAGVTSGFNGKERSAHKLKSDFSTSKRDPGYGMRLSQGPWYASRDITRESFIDNCPSWSYEYVDDWGVIPQKTSKEAAKDQNTAKQNQPNIEEQRQLRQSDGTICSGQANGAQNTMTDPYEDMDLQSSSSHRTNVEGHDVVEETEKAYGQTAGQYEEVDQYEDVDSRRNTAQNKKTDRYEEVISKTATASSGPSHQYEDVNSPTVTAQNQSTGEYEDTRPSEKSTHTITTSTITVTQSADHSKTVNTQVLTHCEDLALAMVPAAQFHAVDQEVAANYEWSTTSGKDCKTVNKANIESKSEIFEKPTKNHKEALKKIMTQLEHISLARGDDFEDVDTIQLYLALKEGLKE